MFQLLVLACFVLVSVRGTVRLLINFFLDSCSDMESTKVQT